MKPVYSSIRLSILLFGVLLLVGLLTQSVMGQTYLGGGYTEFFNRKIIKHDAQGGAISLQREMTLGDSRWQLAPIFQAGLLRDYMPEDDFFLNRTVTLSVSPLVAYQLIRFKKFTFAPYVGPYVGWFTSLTGTNVGFGEQDIYLVEKDTRWLGGVEVGASFSFAFTEQFGMKLTPISAQLGNNGFRQGMLLLLAVRID